MYDNCICYTHSICRYDGSPGVCVVFLICDDGAYVDVLLMMSPDRINRQIDTAIAYVKCCVVMVCMITMSAG